MSWALPLRNLSSKVIGITGTTAGIGYEAARVFAHAGAKVLFLSRNVEKMATAANAINLEKPSDIVQLQCDVSDLDSVKSCAEAFKNMNINRMDVLILNAGGMPDEHEKSPQGYELMFATNHLGHWLLAGLLLEYMKNVEDSRVIIVSSQVHLQASNIDYEAARGLKPENYLPLEAYAESKLANQLMVTSLNRLLQQYSAKTVAVPAHPGLAKTDLLSKWLTTFRKTGGSFSMDSQSVEQGAWPLVMAATDPEINRDSYYGPEAGSTGTPFSRAQKSTASVDVEKAQELWAFSEELCNFKYRF